MKLSITPSDNNKGDERRLTGSHYRYVLINKDGVELDITRSLSRLTLDMGESESNRATISFLLDGIEIEADVLMQLEAHFKEQSTEDSLGI